MKAPSWSRAHASRLLRSRLLRSRRLWRAAAAFLLGLVIVVTCAERGSGALGPWAGFVGTIALAGALLMSFQSGVELLNFGALFGFMAVNAAAFVRFFLRAAERNLADFAVPIGGFVICFLLWINVGRAALTLGAMWLAAGVVFAALKTSGFRTAFVLSEPPPEVE